MYIYKTHVNVLSPAFDRFFTALLMDNIILVLFRLRVDGVPPVSIQLKEITFTNLSATFHLLPGFIWDK